MLPLHVLAAALTALLFTGLYALLLQARGAVLSRTVSLGLVAVFVLLFAAIWGGALWTAPVGPLLWGISWMNFLAVGLVVAALLAAATERRAQPSGATARAAQADEHVPAAGTLFWMVLVLLLLVVIAAYGTR